MTLKIQRWDDTNHEATMLEDTLHIGCIFPNRTKPFYILYSQYMAYTLWCDHPSYSVRVQLLLDEDGRIETWLPSISRGNPFAMEILTEREAMRAELELYTWLHSEE